MIKLRRGIPGLREIRSHGGDCPTCRLSVPRKNPLAIQAPIAISHRLQPGDSGLLSTVARAAFARPGVSNRCSSLFPVHGHAWVWDSNCDRASDGASAAGESGIAWHRGDCPKCHSKRHVYYLHANQPGIEVVGGKRTCPTCVGTGTVRTPLPSKAVPTRG